MELNKLDRQLAEFLRKKRGDMTFSEFSRKVGIPQSTLHRLEQAQQSITLKKLHQILTRLKANMNDIFGN